MTECLAAAGAQGAKECGGVELALQVAAQGQHDGHHGQKHRKGGGEPQELLGPLQRVPHLGAQFAHGLQTLPRRSFPWSLFENSPGEGTGPTNNSDFRQFL